MTPAQQDRNLNDTELANNILVDFCCMPRRSFTLAECAAWHGIPLDYYAFHKVLSLAMQGYFEIEMENNNG